MKFVKFLETNNLKKKDIAAFLGVSNAFITQVCSGERNLPPDKLDLIQANSSIWDTSMLNDTPISQTIGDHSSHNTQIVGERSGRPASVSPEQAEVIRLMAEEIAHLREQIAWMKGIIDDYRQAGK